MIRTRIFLRPVINANDRMICLAFQRTAVMYVGEEQSALRRWNNGYAYYRLAPRGLRGDGGHNSSITKFTRPAQHFAKKEQRPAELIAFCNSIAVAVKQ